MPTISMHWHLLCIGIPLAAQTVTLSSLLDEMIDRDAITRFPEPAYLCLQASSYDRASISSDKPGWFANNDASQFIREEMNEDKKEWVLMDAEGPGAIVRWWITASHYNATFRVYLDGSDMPTIEAPIEQLVGGDFLVGAPLSAVKAGGRNLYFPIPYAKHCKVTVDNMPVQQNLYYQINYRKYVKGTKVETFAMEEFNRLQRTFQRRRDWLSMDDLLPFRHSSNRGKRTVPAGGSITIREYLEEDHARSQRQRYYGPSAFGPPTFLGRMIESMKGQHPALDRLILKVNAEDEEQRAQAMRNVVLSITFDDKETVWCPIGDFFGGGVGVNPYKSRYACIEKDDVMVSRWKMPFQRTMHIKLINYGTVDADVEFSTGIDAAYSWNNRSMYFHANWQQQRGIETVASDGTMDWNYIRLTGRGVFVGDVLSVVNRSPIWWGEGGEKINVDGKKFPTHFGTATDNYYGYAWGTPEFFEAPLHFQSRAEGPDNFGNTTNGRWRSLDAVPFTEYFQFDMEVWHQTATKIDYAATTFWYGFADTMPVDFSTREEQITEVRAPVSYRTPMIEMEPPKTH